MADDTLQDIGFRFETTKETDPISSADTDPADRYWKFGINTNRFTFNHPVEQHLWQPIYKGDHRYPNKLVLQEVQVDEVLAFYPTNLIPFYQVMGCAATHSVAAEVHTITPIEPGNTLETMTIRSESRGGTDDKFLSAVGCKAQSLSLAFNLYQQYPSVSATMTYAGISQYNLSTSARTPTLNSAHNGSKHPTDNANMTTGTEEKNRFKHDNQFAFHWDSSGSNEDFSDDIRNFNCQFVNTMGIEGLSGQPEREFIDEGTIAFMFGFQIVRGNCSELLTDFLAQTQHDFYITVYGGSNNYFKLEFDDVGLNQCRANYAKFVGENRTEPVFDVMGIAEKITVTGKDGLHANAAQNEFFGESL